jgi:hypothetical protein
MRRSRVGEGGVEVVLIMTRHCRFGKKFGVPGKLSEALKIYSKL